ncbi:nodulation factor ABC transporter ATP-binding protein NodI [Sulfuriferula sp. AH1]|nr:nodulation factor ABC transporter ATP-binding protein NodI [Sulfuriferula sp. AH1]
MIKVRNLTKHYGGAEVVRGLDLDIKRGECFGLLGPNGAGKTTTLKMLLGLITPDAGEIRILDQTIPLQARQARLRIGVVPQMDNLDPDFTVAENLLIYGRYFGMADDLINSRIPGLLEFAGLASKADTKITTLSGGMKRRLTLARALVNDPELIVLDEPTTGLDPQARHVIWQGLRRLIHQGKTILLTTHFMEEAERLCDNLVILDHGKVIAAGNPRDLIAAEIEPGVVEIYGEQVDEWARQYGAAWCTRHEITGETLFCYTHDGNSLIAHLREQCELRYVQRPSNLEDVFLKFTGRELRDT